MTITSWATGVCLISTTLQVVSSSIASVRCRYRPGPFPPPPNAPPVSVLRPVCGIDNYAKETLGSNFELDYPTYEVLFCVARAEDPVVPLLHRLMQSNPHIPARLLIGDDRVSDNPKLNNVVKGWAAAAHDWIIVADSNVLMPADYIQRLLAKWQPQTGLVCSTPIGSRPEGFWAEVECAFLNTYQARWQYVGESLGLGFAQGKTMVWRRDILERCGGIAALGAEIAEDAAATKLTRAQGLHVHLVDNPFEQPLGRRLAREVWARQVRWARLRRATFLLYFVPEILAGSALPLFAGAIAALEADVSVPGTLALLAIVWFGAEALLARSAGWYLNVRSPLIWLFRDLLLPFLWIDAWRSDDFVWRGNEMNVSESKEST